MTIVANAFAYVIGAYTQSSTHTHTLAVIECASARE